MRKNLLVLAFIFCGFIASYASIQDSIGTVVLGEKEYIQYMVSPGETIYRISTKYGVSISTLLELNPDLENGLKVGQVIRIPYKKAYVAAQKEKVVQEELLAVNDNSVHEVLPGETLYSISKKFGVTVGDLLKWNGLELKAGQAIYVANPSTNDKEVVSNQSTSTVNPVRQHQTKSAEIVVEKPQVTKPIITEPSAPTTSKATPKAVVVEKPVIKEPEVPTNEPLAPKMNVYDFNPNYKQVLIVPFDPHLYFSDADDEIAQASHVPRNHVREVFRRRLNSLLDPRGYETIHLMGGRFADTLADLNKIYSSVNYNYEEILESEFNTADTRHSDNQIKPTEEPANKFSAMMNKAKDKVGQQPQATNAHNAAIAKKEEKFEGKFFGVKIKDPKFFEYFHNKYSIDYYVFVNQFEVVTDYEHCLDRAAQNYQRYFITHYSIFDKEGNPIAGNKYKVYYDSNSNDIERIVADNVLKISQRILNDLPAPGSNGY